jgi:hypothetical protein
MFPAGHLSVILTILLSCFADYLLIQLKDLSTGRQAGRLIKVKAMSMLIY